MPRFNSFPAHPTRRRFVAAAFASAAAGPLIARVDGETAPPRGRLSNGGPDPFPIPWLDKNGNHNQPAGPELDPSHVFHFKGRVARCAGFTGMGTDNKGNRIGFGTKTTDYGFMDGEYFAARVPHPGALTHI